MSIFFLGLVFHTEAASRRYSYEEENRTLLREMKDSLEELRHEVSNHETEIRMYDEKLKNQELIIESLREQLTQGGQGNKDLLKELSVNLGLKITNLDTAIKGINSDLRQFKTYSNESSSSLVQYKQKIGELEKVLEAQNQNMESMQTALQALMDAFQVKGSSSIAKDAGIKDSNSKTYRVKTGDSLEKIARSHQTTIQAIKDLNMLANDKIIIGQVLRLP